MKLLGIIQRAYSLDEETHEDAYEQYIKVHGKHFTKELAEYALTEFVKKVEFAKVEEFLTKNGCKSKDAVPDIVYLATHVKHLYEEFSGEEVDCINHAILLIADNLAHILFENWAKEHKHINWLKYI